MKENIAWTLNDLFTIYWSDVLIVGKGGNMGLKRRRDKKEYTRPSRAHKAKKAKGTSPDKDSPFYEEPSKEEIFNLLENVDVKFMSIDD